MSANLNTMRPYLQKFDFKSLFINELNWGISRQRPWVLELEPAKYQIIPLVEQGGLVVFEVTSLGDGLIPNYATRRKIETKVKSQVHEHILIFENKGRTKSTWQWVRRGAGQSAAAREHHYFKGQPGDSLLQKLIALGFDFSELDEDGKVTISAVTGKVSRALDVEKVTKRFFDEFEKEHDVFCEFLKGLEKQDELEWYASVMLNRLMFIYFIQKKCFLDGNIDYLRTRLKESKRRGPDQFYKSFLTRLFFEGFAKEEKERSSDINQLLGTVPYLNGGLFLPHQLEQAYGQKISISDAAFEKIFTFFERYDWHLDYRPLKNDREINPDVLGYIFEKYINQKQMGAYYTKEDITDYISKNTIIPFLFDKLAGLRPSDLQPFPIADVDPYIYDAVKQEEYLPTETDREHQARRNRYEQIKADFAAGKITGINDLITYNLDVRSFATDWVNNITNPFTLRTFYFHCLTKVTVLDPTVGSGAFLFAALNILEPLYEICLDKMQELGDPVKYPDFAEELRRVNLHPNRKYFILKSIIINNLFGVDIMEEAVEICKLRLFLKLVAQVDDVKQMEPLPDIDFNIRAGNTLVGYANENQIKMAKATQLDLGGGLASVEKRIETADRYLQAFREAQTKFGASAFDLGKAKSEVKARLAEIQNELDKDMFAYYGARNFELFKQTHQPFHWIVEFYSVMRDGGFSVIVGNPPYVEYTEVQDTYTVRGYRTEKCGNLYSFVIERCLHILNANGRLGQIIPLPAMNTSRMKDFQELLRKSGRNTWVSSFDERPSNLFIGVDQRLSILLVGKYDPDESEAEIFTTGINRWGSIFRPYLFSKIHYVRLRVPPGYATSAIMKASDDIESSIFSKWVKHAPISQLLANKSNRSSGIVAYRTAGGRYWKVFLDRPFETESLSNKVAYLQPGTDPKAIVGVLSSSLFWWYYSLHFDMYNLKDYMIFGFRFDYSRGRILNELSLLGAKLIETLETTAETTTIKSRTRGIVHSKLYVVSKAKSIIDEIDRTLAKHYGFTEKEVDFIINYDIKYRMGKDGGEEQD